MPLGVYYTGVLMDAACHLLDINMIVVVQPDPYFEPFGEVLTFSETDILHDNIIITIQVHTYVYMRITYLSVIFVHVYTCCVKRRYGKKNWIEIAWEVVEGA